MTTGKLLIDLNERLKANEDTGFSRKLKKLSTDEMISYLSQYYYWLLAAIRVVKIMGKNIKIKGT